MCCIFGQCFSSSMTGGFFFLIYMYPELSSYRIVFCLRLYRISDPCLTSVRYHQISLDVVLWKYLHCPLSFLQTPEPLVFFTFPAQHIKWTNHFVNFFNFIFLRTCILSLHWRKLIINDGLFNSTIRSNKYLQDFPFKHKCIWNKSKKKLTKWKFIICWRGQCIFFFFTILLQLMLHVGRQKSCLIINIYRNTFLLKLSNSVLHAYIFIYLTYSGEVDLCSK